MARERGEKLTISSSEGIETAVVIARSDAREKNVENCMVAVGEVSTNSRNNTNSNIDQVSVIRAA